ncbi:MAG: bifunctional 5,10-methylenetetrahydrofolate dehydrogenase/5,10-methenyltetrahydrofolate cyclohydrolase [Rickettsiales bacterium]|nr:bifunctional 5,10-methylenetetrahydrofolate dehydrogenase/5,10-methenyltetrahydrofolate cyclohydrolase [Rickettsiales bacterium]
MNISEFESRNRIDCVSRALYIRERLSLLIEAEKSKQRKLPKMAILQVGDNFASNIYIRNKIKVADKVGIDVDLKKFDDNITECALIEHIISLNHNNDYCGMIVQLPLPQHIDVVKVLSSIAPNKDLDGLNPINAGLLHYSKYAPYCVDDVINKNIKHNVIFGKTLPFIPCTPLGCLDILQQEEKRSAEVLKMQNGGVKTSQFSIQSSNAVVIGNSNLVGKPIARLLTQSGATTTTIHSRSKNFDIFLQNADIIVSATGAGQALQNIKENAIVIDVAIRKDKNGNICGDIEYEKVVQTNRITPVPCGIGPMTISCLMLNYYLALHCDNL